MGLGNKCIIFCGQTVACCPGLRAKSRKPAKRYKRLLADIFPRTPDGTPDTRKAGKLAEYAAKNPARIPKIANALEQRGYKELRSERYGYVVVVMKAYSKLLSACQDQMSLFAVSCLSMIRALLGHRRDDMRILGCDTFVDFVVNQRDAQYMHMLEQLLPNFTSMARETGDEQRRRPLRAAGLSCIGVMINFMEEFAHISLNFEELVVVILDNYSVASFEEEDEPVGSHSPGPMDKAKDAIRDAFQKLQDKKHGKFQHGHKEKPEAVAQKCVKALARFSKEATTLRRVLDPMFRYFDNGKHWGGEIGLAAKVLRQMQRKMEKEKLKRDETASGRSHLLLTWLVRHLDSKTVTYRSETFEDIVQLLTRLVHKSRAKPGLSEVELMRELARHLRRSLERAALTAGDRTVESEEQKRQKALEDCLQELARRVGDAGPVLDMMAAVLEKLAGPPIASRATVGSMLVVARAVAELHDEVHHTKETFPDGLFLQLLQVMIFHDPGTRVLGHELLAALLPPVPGYPSGGKEAMRQTSVAAAVSQAVQSFEKLIHKESKKHEKDGKDKKKEKEGEGKRKSSSHESEDEDAHGHRRRDSLDGHASTSGTSPRPLTLSASGKFGNKLMQQMSLVFRGELPDGTQDKKRRSSTAGSKEGETHDVRFSGLQAELLLSALWIQATKENNLPPNYEAMAHVYSLVVYLSKPKTDNHHPMVRALQLALSIRTLSLQGVLDPPRSRSLFTLSTALLAQACKAYGLMTLLPTVLGPYHHLKERCPWLELDSAERLRVVPDPPVSIPEGTSQQGGGADYASEKDQVAVAGVWPPPLETVFHPGEENRALSEAIVTASEELDTSPNVMKTLQQTFTPEDHFALRPRILAAIPSSPLNERLLRSNTLVEDREPSLSVGGDEGGQLTRNQSLPDVSSWKEKEEIPSVEEVIRRAEESMADPLEVLGASGHATREPILQLTGHSHQPNGGEVKEESDGIPLEDTPNNVENGSSSSNNPWEGSVALKQAIDEAMSANDEQCGSWESFELPPASAYDVFLHSVVGSKAYQGGVLLLTNGAAA